MGDANELEWGEPVTHGGITATVTKHTECDIHCDVNYRVTLTGPDARSEWYNSNPSPIAKPKLPQAS
ncbi:MULTISPECIES: hypothetical protein [unclassified Gilliamella]|uniref:hypothetical protein n=1 Tax=unclassified Gilliamella TaxID=2685620 RepID=UPI00130BB975|nr:MULTISPECIES: hypothetical protein [unclassified Gilliamella]MWP49354.1 hypothetical protein [Gilliamella sp. Lep-s35]MWP68978.1 hypothetical protein [Gilliamella sp. Lep-s5]MWP77345.1 hypothetical protein [Gilliamella sp. Lep-s21]